MHGTLIRRLLAGVATALLGMTAQAEPVTLNVSAWKGGSAEPAGFPELIARFEKENPDIKIKFDYVARNDTTTIMSSRLQSGAAPDVMMVDRPLMRQWAGAGQLMDISAEPAVAQLGADVKPQAQLDGKAYMLPMEIVGIGLFSNLDLLKRAGVEHVPASLGELKASCAKLRAAGITPLLLPAKDGWAPAMMALALGLSPTLKADPGFVAEVVSGKQKFSTNPNFKKSMAVLKDLAEAKCYDPKLNVGVDPWNLGLSEFMAGRVAMIPQGAWSIQKFSAGAKSVNFAFTPFPGLDGGKPVGMDMLGTAWAVNASTRNATAAKRWLQFWSRDANLGKFLAAEGGFSPFANGGDWMPKAAQGYAAARRAGDTIPYPKGEFSSAFFTEMQKSMTAYMLNIDQDPVAILGRWDAAPQKQ